MTKNTSSVINSFESFHPLVNFYYFAGVIACTMFFMHPVFLVISFLLSFAYSVMLNGKKAVRFNLLYMLPILVITAVINPAFSHQGVTILGYLRSGNPLTLESIVFGICSAFMFVSVILWFSCYNAVMSSDKFIYLFGRIIPSLSLIFSMVLRFVPRYKNQIKEISNSQKCIGKDVSDGNLIQRAKNGMKIISIMVTWALENGIETADSMKSRGYGLKGRTSFSNFRFDSRDKKVLSLMIVFTIVILFGAYMGENTMVFFPSMYISDFTPLSALVYLSYFGLCSTPLCIEVIENKRWARIKGEIR
ncbi:MAG: energy-coupling factor transporter transmembrane protein EcfT [Clostridioides sp.]|nr:energy-coupling factor transporter transmembrane protein EcfT [Clostridioides sp.]